MNIYICPVKVMRLFEGILLRMLKIMLSAALPHLQHSEGNIVRMCRIVYTMLLEGFAAPGSLKN